MGKKESPWLMRTYSGYASAKESNLLYRTNLAKGQTGLSIAFDLPTQAGYDSDDPLARGEVGKLGVPVRTYEDMDLLFDQIPIEKMNTSMTINAPAAWMLGLYIATAKKQGATIAKLAGTTQNDILKEYLNRGTYIFPPKPSMSLTAEVICYTVNNIPQGIQLIFVLTICRRLVRRRCRSWLYSCECHNYSRHSRTTRAN